MIQSYGTNQTVTSNSAITFPTDHVRTGIVVTKSSDGGTFYLNRPGIYMLSFDATGLPTADGDVSAQVKVNGVDIVPAKGSIFTGAGETGEISINTLIMVDRVCACAGGKPVQVVYTGAAGVLATANIVITKIR